jgi:hypothetical protein
MRSTTSRVVIMATVATTACLAYWWAQTSREEKPGAHLPPASSVAQPLNPLKSAPPENPQLVAQEIRKAEAPAARAHPEEVPAMEQELEAEQAEAEEQARLQAVQFELGSVLSREAVDREFSDKAQADIGAAITDFGSNDVRLVSTDCRTTLCRLEVWSADIEAIGAFLDAFPVALGWSTDMRMDTQASAGGGMLTTLFITRNGVAMPTLAAEQR